jgi:hypothetical protein
MKKEEKKGTATFEKFNKRGFRNRQQQLYFHSQFLCYMRKKSPSFSFHYPRYESPLYYCIIVGGDNQLRLCPL